MIKKTLYVNEDIHGMLKVISQFNGTSITQLVEETLKDSLIPVYNKIREIQEHYNAKG